MSDIKKLLESIDSIENVKESKLIGHNYRFKDYLGGTEPVRKQKPGVLATKKQTNKLVGDGGESVNVSGTPIEEDMVTRLAQEFADFLKDKQPVMDNMFPAAEDHELGKKPEDRELTSEAKPKKPADTPEDRRKQGRCVDCGQPLSVVGRGDDGRCRECEADQQIDEQQPTQHLSQQTAGQPNITNIAGQLSNLLGIDDTDLKNAYRAPRPNNQQLSVLASAFKKLIAADTNTKIKALAQLKKIAAEEPGQL